MTAAGKSKARPTLFRRPSAEELQQRDEAGSAAAPPLAPIAEPDAAGAVAHVGGVAPAVLAAWGPGGVTVIDGALHCDGRPVTPGMTIEVPTALISETPYNARVYYRSQEIDEMVTSLDRFGQEVSAEGWVENGRVWLVDGGKRYRASRAGGRPTVRVEIKAKPSDAREIYLASRRMNVERSAQTAIDDAVRFRTLLDEGVFPTQEALGEAVGIKKAMVSTIMSLTRIPERLLGRMKESDVTSAVGVACEVARLFIDRAVDDDATRGRSLDPDDAEDQRVLEERELIAEEIIDEAIRKELTRSDVQRLVRSRIRGPQQRARADVREVRWKGQRGQLKVTPKKRAIEIALPEIDEDRFEALVSRLEAVLAGE